MRVDRAERFFRGCRRTLAALTALTLVAACTPRPNEDLASIDAPAGDMVGDNVDLQRDYVLGHNDLIDLKVFGQDNLSGEYRVAAGGAISIPLLGDVPDSGRTAAALTPDDNRNRLVEGKGVLVRGG